MEEGSNQSFVTSEIPLEYQAAVQAQHALALSLLPPKEKSPQAMEGPVPVIEGGTMQVGTNEHPVFPSELSYILYTLQNPKCGWESSIRCNKLPLAQEWAERKLKDKMAVVIVKVLFPAIEYTSRITDDPPEEDPNAWPTTTL